MNPVNAAVTELRLVVDRAYAKALDLMQRHAEGPDVGTDDLQDHRTEILGELLDAIDRIDPGLGATLLKAMYPLTNDDPDITFAEVPR